MALNKGKNLQTRTLGDGMDNKLLTLTEKNKIPIGLNVKPKASVLKSLQPVEFPSKVTYLIPKYVPKDVKPSVKYLKPKEPKFIPYEPYKAAIHPIKPRKMKKTLPTTSEPKNRNNVEIQELVTQMSAFRMQEMNKTTLKALENQEELIPRSQWEKQKEEYEKDLKNLLESNACLENQLKFQAQVNSELKTLLVAAVGEDLESRVQHLTEDKLQLARALLNSANHLTSHQEQTEWLSGQCEVWRSKFLASSLMVEELARWKSALTQRLHDYQEISKHLLEDFNRINRQNLQVYNNLSKIAQHLSLDCQKSQSNTNNLFLAKANMEISDKLCNHFNLPTENNIIEEKICHTIAEKTLIKLSQNPVKISGQQEAVCNAVLGAATTISGQMYLQQPTLYGHGMCCAHCKGEIQNI